MFPENSKRVSKINSIYKKGLIMKPKPEHDKDPRVPHERRPKARLSGESLNSQALEDQWQANEERRNYIRRLEDERDGRCT